MSWLAKPDAGTLHRPTALVLVGANLIPLLGVLAFGWDLGTIILLFWLENAVVGIFHLVKVAVVGKAMALFMVPFFMVHYGMFMMVHLIFIVFLFLDVDFFVFDPLASVVQIIQDLLATTAGLWVAILGLVLSHGFSFLYNFVWKEEWRTTNAMLQMAAPYKRVVILHVTIIFGGFVTLLLGSPVLAIVFLVVIKTIVDLLSHVAEHRGTSNNDDYQKAYSAE